MTDINKSIDHIYESSTAIAAAMEEQTAATSEIARNVTEAATGTAEVSRSVGIVQGSSQETGKIAESLLSLANFLAENAENLLGQVSRSMEDSNKGAKSYKH